MTMAGAPRAHLSRPLRAREEAHRRGILVWMGALIVFSTSPVFGHHLATRADAMLAGQDHLFRLCLVALHLLLAPVHLVFHILLAAGLAYATWDRVRAWRSLQGALRSVQWSAPDEVGALARAARAARVPLDRIRVVEGLPNPAFTAGWWRPTVYVAASLGDTLDESQLASVLAHEHAHIARRDPLRLSLLRFLACTLFYLPALRRLADDAADEAEIAADDVAADTMPPGGAVILASAIVEIARRWGGAAGAGDDRMLAPGGAAVGFQRVDLVDRRVRRLLGEEAAVGTHVTARSLAGAGAILTAVWVSGLIMAHPLPAGVEADGGWFASSNAVMPGSGPSDEHAAHGTHCNHHHGFAFTHLFCLGADSHPAGSPCPHTVMSAPDSTARPG